jgi:hypothetical protein
MEEESMTIETRVSLRWLAVAALAALAALAGCSGLPLPLPGFGASAPGPDPQICGALRNTANTGAMGHRPSQENAVRDMQRRGCPDIPKL